MKCFEVNLDDPKPLYRFVLISRKYKPTMILHCLKLLGMHFLSFLTEYENTRKQAIDEIILRKQKEFDDVEKDKIDKENKTVRKK